MTDLSIVAIIPLYNGAKWIEQSIRSVFAQALQPHELVVVDDGSTDGGAGIAVVERLAQERPITLLRKPNGGQSSARNFGIAHSECALIALLDQDDIWYPRHLEMLVEPFRTETDRPLGWTYSNLDMRDEENRLIYLTALDRPGRGTHPKLSVHQCVTENMHVLPSASLISRMAFESVGGFDEQFIGFEDDDLFLRLLNAGYGNVYITQALSHWRIHPVSTSQLCFHGHSQLMDRSRKRYAHKLLNTFPTERSSIITRFSISALGRGYRAVRRLDVRTAWMAGLDLLDIVRCALH